MKRRKRPPARKVEKASALRGARAAAAPPRPSALRYKVVELSTVDEGSLEHTVNDWVRQGWALDGIQFAMRESSKRPSMAFVLFTREASPEEATDSPDPAEAKDRLRRLAEPGPAPVPLRPHGAVSAQERLAQLAGLDESGRDPNRDADD